MNLSKVISIIYKAIDFTLFNYMINIQRLNEKSYFRKSIYSITQTIVNFKENWKK